VKNITLAHVRPVDFSKGPDPSLPPFLFLPSLPPFHPCLPEVLRHVLVPEAQTLHMEGQIACIAAQ
jgi:hypothetical protein